MSDERYPAWPDLFRWLTVLKDRVETLPVLSAEQVVTGTFDPSLIPPIPWDDVLKAGSSLGDLETRSASDLSSGTLSPDRMPGLTGDVSSTTGSVATTLATVNTSPGSFGSGTLIPIISVNGKGLVTAVTQQPIQTGALTRVNDTNITATLGGTPATALLKDVSITLGWAGTLSAVRGGTAQDTSSWSGVPTINAGVWTQNNVLTATRVLFAGAGNTIASDADLTFSVDTLTATKVLAPTSVSTPSIITASGALSITPASGSNLNIALATTGDFAVNTNQLYVDTSTGNIGIGTASPGASIALIVSSPTISLDKLVSSNSENLTFRDNGTNKATFGIAAGNDDIIVGSVLNDFAIRANSQKILFSTDAGSTAHAVIKTGKFGIGTTNPTAVLHLKAGTATANTAPFKFTSGTLLTTAEAGAVEFLTDAFYGTITTGAARKTFAFLESPAFTTPDIGAATGASLGLTAAIGKYKNVNTAGWGMAAIYASGRSTAQVAAVASVATYTNGAADGSFVITSNVNVTTSTTHNFNVQVDYTDETNTAQTLTLTFSQLSGVLVTAITNVTGAGPYEGVSVRIRCKASTAITVKTTGIFTTLVYNVEAAIQQLA